MNDQHRALAEEIVRSHVVYSLGAGLVPVPLLDIAAVSAVQLHMLQRLAKVYGKDFKESAGKGIISALTGSTMARIGASMVKSIPGIGSILGGVTMSVLSGASTFAVGQVFVWHFADGGDLFDFDFDKAKKVYEREFEKGKKVAREMESRMEDQKAGESQTVSGRIEQLARLRDQGLITDEEFQQQKARILSEL